MGFLLGFNDLIHTMNLNHFMAGARNTHASLDMSSSASAMSPKEHALI